MDARPRDDSDVRVRRLARRLTLGGRAALAALILLAAALASAHRLDEYLQAAILTIEKDRVDVQLTLTPGVAVVPALVTEIDTDHDGALSSAEQNAYAARVLHDMTWSIDARPLTPQIRSLAFPTLDEMKEGRGEIHIDFSAALPGGGVHRKLILDNHHMPRISAYQVNALVPRDPDIRIIGQNRNYTQSHYELEYTQPGVRWDVIAPLGVIAVLVAVGLAFFVRRKPVE